MARDEASYQNGTLPNAANSTCSTLEMLSTAVLIVGGGPTGLLQALCLSRCQVRSIIVERYPSRLGAPKAHAVCPRSLEIFRQLGLDISQIRSRGSPRRDAFWVNFATSLDGKAVGVLPYERMDINVLDETPEMIHNIPQPELEQILTAEVSKDENIDLRKGISFQSLEQHDDGVTTTVRELESGREFCIQSRHVVACDGARSRVRECLGIECDGESSDETMMTIHFSANLRPILGERVGMLHWIMDPEGAGLIIGYNLSGNLVHISPVDVGEHPVETWTEEMSRRKVSRAIGREYPCQIHSTRPWIFRRQIAKEFRVKNVFLAGDAAHSFPPTGGLGLNCGLADGHSLAYKLAGVHQGWASDAVLDSYHRERHPVADIYSLQSIKNGKQIFALVRSLDADGLGDSHAARQKLFEALNDARRMEKISQAIESQREHFDNLELHIGYVYGDPVIPRHASHYKPKFRTGARLPHAWIALGDAARKLLVARPVSLSYIDEFSAEDQTSRRYSTLDLCAPDAFTLIVGEVSTWRERIRDLKSFYRNGNLKLNAFGLDHDFSLSKGGVWAREAGVSEGGGLLVRPDQHILMRLGSQTSSQEILLKLTGHLGK